MNEQHDAAIRGSLHKIASALAHLWLTACWLKHKRLPTRSEYWVYSHHLEWGFDMLDGDAKRIKVTIEVEDWRNADGSLMRVKKGAGDG